MTPEEWQRIKQVMGDALDQPDTRSRLEFLSAACDGDRVLQSEIEAMLAHASDRLDVAADSLAGVPVESDGSGSIGQRLGDYELIRELGRGGMGTIYLARRADEEFEKEVAIKILKRGTDTEEVLRRFRAERQILAQLEHPNIAHLIDAGTSPDGLPYFVMEYVDGMPINEYCTAANLSVRQRIALFTKVCGALHFAHQNLVVHRDLKPGNILITANGEPKLLDFGIAKLLSPGGDFLLTTIQNQQRFTPAYASPEQIRGDPVTTASDVYSLGALLYELLAGQAPHRFETSHPSPTELFRVIVEREPPRVSSIPTDLDTILRKALSKEPQRRYSGASALAEDLTRYLDDRPVRARPATFAYRASRFVRRNKVGVAASAAILVVVLAGATAYILETGRTAFHAQREAAHFRDLRQLANLFIFKYHDGIAAFPGSTELRKQLVKDALDYLNNLARAGTDDPTLLREIATAYKRIGDVQGGVLTNVNAGGTISASNLGDTAGALENYNKARTIRERLANLQPNDSEIRFELAEINNNLGEINVTLGRPAEAAGHFRHSIDALRLLLSNAPNEKRLLSELRSSYWALATVLAINASNLGDVPGALEAMRNGIVLGEALVTQEPANAQFRQALATGYGETGRVLFNDGDAAGALEYYRKALAIGETLAAENPQIPLYQRELAVQHRNVGGALLEIGEKAEALAHFRDAVALFEKLITADPQDARLRRSAAYGYRDLGEALSANGDRPGAQENLEKSLHIFEELGAKDPKNTVVIFQQAVTHLKFSRFFLDAGDVPRARSSAERALMMAQEIAARDANDINARKTVAEIHGQLGNCAGAVANKPGESAEACAFYRQSAEVWRDVRAKGKFNRADAKKLHDLESALGRCDAGVAVR
ncbi:MAG TPA: protein kinase [Chthoniobacterales bacterium]|jgi:non-specific serine/threonine protein kinase/serine/threonine-protein kinase|nr:protein kinase [Chthoniobacterales bacterium]